MKKDLHPGNYRMVVFKDMSNGTTFLSRSHFSLIVKIPTRISAVCRVAVKGYNALKPCESSRMSVMAIKLRVMSYALWMAS